MKAIIVDFDGDYLIVANSRGDFKRIYNNYPGCQVGDEINIKESRTAFFGAMLSSIPQKKALAIIACFLLMIITSYGVYGYVNPVTYVTVDINPSVELSLNKYNLVLDARGLNDEGNVIVGNGREYRNMKLDKAFNKLLSRAMEANYLNMNTNTVMLTVSNIKDSLSPNIKKQLKDVAKAQLNNIIDEEKQNTSSVQQEPKVLGAESLNAQDTSKNDIIIIVENTTFEKHQEAKKMDISQGKLVLYEKLKKVKPDAVLNHVKEASVTQIIEEIEKIKLEQTEKYSPKGKDNGNNKNQLFKDIKSLEKDMKNQLKDIKKDNKSQQSKGVEIMGKEIKDQKNQGQPTNIIKDMKKQIDKVLKNESQLKKADSEDDQKEDIKDDQKEDLKNNGQNKNSGSDKVNKKKPDVPNDKAKNDKSKEKSNTKSKNNKK